MLDKLIPASRARLIAGLGLLALLLVAILLWRGAGASQSAEDRKDLLWTSTIPLQWGETDLTAIAKGKGEAAAAFVRLESRYRMKPVDNLLKLDAPSSRMFLLVQPRLLSPAELVAFDKWIHAGGQALILADPALQWPSAHPMGDTRRPLFTSLLNPLFRHWGVELVLPAGAEEAEQMVAVGSYDLKLVSAGVWQPFAGKTATAHCRIGPAAVVAECRPGRGRAVLLADADMLDSEQWQRGYLLGGSGGDNMAWVEAVLAALQAGESLESTTGILWEKSR
jgi:hypothetical protein